MARLMAWFRRGADRDMERIKFQQAYLFCRLAELEERAATPSACAAMAQVREVIRMGDAFITKWDRK